MKKNNKTVSFSLIVCALFMFNSCLSYDKYEEKNLSNQAIGFKYENISQTNVSFSFKNFEGLPSAGVVVEIYSENPNIPGTSYLKENPPLCLKGITNNEGVYQTEYSFPNGSDSIYVRVVNPLYKEVQAFAKAAVGSQVIYPMGVGVMQGNTKSTRGVTDPVLYNKNTTRLPVSPNLYVLGDYNSVNGLPYFLTDPNRPIPSELITKIAEVLPPGSSNPATYRTNVHPEWFQYDQFTNIDFIAEAHAWITFMSEGAGVNNTLGYFYYPTNNPPKNAAEIAKRIIIFPNSSAMGSGGALVSGNSVALKYYDEATGLWKETFPAGTTLSWFLATDGWMNNSQYGALLRNNTVMQYSLKAFNNGGKPQSIMFYDSNLKKLILGFEDISCADIAGTGRLSSDQDFNDVIYMVETDPVNAVDLPKFNKLKDKTDNDGDGVANEDDDYPEDPTRAFDNYYPNASTFGTLAFEDKWPNKGDYDFNDLVVDYRVNYVTNAAGLVKDVIPTFRVRAIGANFENGFALELNAATSNVESISTTYLGGQQLLKNEVFKLNPVGYEEGVNSLVVPFFDNAFNLLGLGSVSYFVNTISYAPAVSPMQLTKKITFKNPVTVASLGTAPYNPFIVVNKDRGIEVHKTGKPATSLARVGLFHTADDLSDQTSLWYVGSQNYPWVIDTPITFEYPAEGKSLGSVYLKFNNWVSSYGSQYPDWYSNTTTGYRNNANLYKAP